jgi:hypothetical protein
MTVLPRLFPAGSGEMSHDISCKGQDPNLAPAKYLEKRYSCGTVPFQKETFAASLWGTIISHKYR